MFGEKEAKGGRGVFVCFSFWFGGDFIDCFQNEKRFLFIIGFRHQKNHPNEKICLQMMKLNENLYVRVWILLIYF